MPSTTPVMAIPLLAAPALALAIPTPPKTMPRIARIHPRIGTQNSTRPTIPQTIPATARPLPCCARGYPPYIGGAPYPYCAGGRDRSLAVASPATAGGWLLATAADSSDPSSRTPAADHGTGCGRCVVRGARRNGSAGGEVPVADQVEGGPGGECRPAAV